MSGRREARDIVNALRIGTVPDRGLRHLAVGLGSHLGSLMGQLGLAEQGSTEIRFLEGAYGAGKTFLSSLLREEAHAIEFASSFAVVSPRHPLGQAADLYHQLIDGLRTRHKSESSALGEILEEWLLREQRALQDSVRGHDDLAAAVSEAIDRKLDLVHVEAPGVANVVQSYYRARLERRRDVARNALAWLRGFQNLTAPARREIGVRGHIADEDPLAALRAIGVIVRAAGYRGWLIVVDELETAQRLTLRRQRDDAYELLRVLVDGAGENRFPHTLFVLTGTPELFSNERHGIPSYRALAQRVLPSDRFWSGGSSREMVLRLEGLQAEQLLRVARRVRDLHAAAYGWPAAERVGDRFLGQMADQVTESFGERLPRLPRSFLREVVHVCDAAQEHGLTFEADPDQPLDDRIAARLQEELRSPADPDLGVH